MDNRAEYIRNAVIMMIQLDGKIPVVGSISDSKGVKEVLGRMVTLIQDDQEMKDL